MVSPDPADVAGDEVGRIWITAASFGWNGLKYIDRCSRPEGDMGGNIHVAREVQPAKCLHRARRARQTQRWHRLGGRALRSVTRAGARVLNVSGPMVLVECGAAEANRRARR